MYNKHCLIARLWHDARDVPMAAKAFYIQPKSDRGVAPGSRPGSKRLQIETGVEQSGQTSSVCKTCLVLEFSNEAHLPFLG